MTCRLASGPRGARSRLFCHFQFHGEGPDHPLQLSDAVLASLLLAPEEDLQSFEGDVLPASDELGLQLVLPGYLGLALQAGNHFENNLGFELGGEGSASTLGHRERYRDGQY
jgi:hypothetical protein